MPGLGHGKEVLEDALPYAAAFLRVELRGVEIALVHGGAVGVYVVGRGYRLSTQGNVVAVDKIDEGAFGNAVEQWGGEVAELVPTHRWHFLIVMARDEAANIGGEYAEAVDVALLAVAA